MVANGIPGPPLQRIQALRQVFGWLELLERCHRRYGDVFRLRIPGTGPVVVLAEPELIRAVYIDNEATIGGMANTGFMRRLLSGFEATTTVNLMVGDEHLRRRRLILPALHGDHLRSYERVMVAAIDERLDRWEPGATVDMLAFADELSIDIAVRVLFGAVDAATAARLRALIVGAFSPWAATVFAALLPDRARLDRFPGPWRTTARRRRELRRLIAAQVRARSRRPGDDICSLLLAASDEDGAHLSEWQLSDELQGLGIAGSHSTVVAIAWMFDHVLHDAAALARVEDAPGDERLGRAVANETLRLRPSGDSLPRTLAHDIELGEYRLTAGETVLPCAYLVHRRPDLYERPTEFLPDRFLARQPSSSAFLPFGAGAHRCVAASFAQLELRTVLRRVFERWRLRPARPAVSDARRGTLGVWMPANGVPVTVVEPRRAA